MFTYDQNLYERQVERSTHSAWVVAPTLLDILPARSGGDAGCCVDTWLSGLARFGVFAPLGRDWNWVDRRPLRMPTAQFRTVR